MFVLTMEDSAAKTFYEFAAMTRQDVLDEFTMWLTQEQFDFRFEPNAMQALLSMHDQIRFGGHDSITGKETDVLFTIFQVG